MIFLFFFAIIALIVIALNMKDNANLELIKKHFEEQNCQNIVYAKGSYKGICKEKIMQISNSFSVDLEANRSIFELKNIKNLEQKDNRIIINSTYNIEFKTKENRDIFYKKLKENLHK